MSVDVCSDDRFELIAEARDALLERTNVGDSPDEMAVLDSILFRCWQMGWLDADPDPYGRRVLTAIDQLRRDLSDYHGQLKAHSDLQIHCDRQRERIAYLEGLCAKVKAERDETAMAFSKEHDRAEFLMRENERLRKELEFERGENRFAIDFLNTIGPHCGQPDCPSLVEYVEKLRKMVHKLWSMVYWYAPDLSELDEVRDYMRELGIEAE